MTNLIRLYDFDGGIHPNENKTQSTQQPIQTAPIAPELVLPLHQHIGAPSEPLVQVGDTVLKGQVLTKAKGFVSVPLHAPTSGTVSAIEPRGVPHASGLKELCIVIKTDGEDRWIDHHNLLDEHQVDDFRDIETAALIRHISNSGIAGMGGAGFPTAVKLHTGQREIHTLILNGAECEPYITADDMLMRERAQRVISGAQVLLHILGAKRCMIGVEDNKPEAVAALNKALIELHEEHHIDVVSIPTKYPSGGEKQLIQILTGEEVPSGGIPADLGIVCQNVGTAAAISDAVYQGRPLISRITTLTGDAHQAPGNWEVLFGTPVNFLLQLGDYQPQKRQRVIMGGPMMGFALPSLDLPVVKTTNCLLAPTEKELPPNDIAMACIRCGMCADACPAELLPQQLYWFSKAQEFDKAEQHNLFDCIECGACSYVCPSHIPLVQYYRFAKGSVREERAAQAKAEKAKERFEYKQFRQEREKEEKEAKRRARAEASAKAQAAKKAAATSVATAAPATAATPAASNDANSPERLKNKWDMAQSRLETAQQRLNEAQQKQQDNVEALQGALEKQQQRVNEAKAAYQAATSSTSAPAAVPAVDTALIEKLEKQLKSAQTAKSKTEEKVAEAKADPDKADKVQALEDALQRTLDRIKDIEAKLAAAKQPAAVTASAPVIDTALIEKLEKQLKSAQAAKAKTEEKVAEAEADPAKADKVQPLKDALQRTLERLSEIESKLQAAKNPPAAAPLAAVPVIDTAAIEKLEKQLKSAVAAKAKTEEKVAEAEADPEKADKVQPLKEALQRTLDRIKDIEGKLEAAKNPQAVAAVQAAPVAVAPEPDPVAIEKLEKQLKSALAAKAKTEEKVAEAEADPEKTDKVQPLKDALQRTLDRIKDIDGKLEAAKNPQAVAAVQTAPVAVAPEPDPVAIEKLEKQLKSAQAAKAKTEEKVAEAEADPEKADKVQPLKDALQRTLERITGLEEKLQAAKNPQPVAAMTEPVAQPKAISEPKPEPVPVPQPEPDPAAVEKLEKQLVSAENARSKTEEKIAEAEADPEKAEKVQPLKEALQRTLDRIETIKGKIAVASGEVAPAPQVASASEAVENQTEQKPATENETENHNSNVNNEQLEALQRKIRAQQDRVDKSRERLEMAQQQGLETVDALTRALEKQQTKLAGLQSELAQSGADSASAEENA